MKENEAAIVIQNCFRRYLQRNKGAVQPSVVRLDENDNHVTQSKVESEKLVQDLNLFHEKLQQNRKKKEELKNLCAELEEIISNLKKITTLAQCKLLKTSHSEAVNLDLTKERHQEQIRQSKAKWWQNLDRYEAA